VHSLFYKCQDTSLARVVSRSLSEEEEKGLPTRNNVFLVKMECISESEPDSSSSVNSGGARGIVEFKHETLRYLTMRKFTIIIYQEWFVFIAGRILIFFKR